jgi:hypothetical protein
MLLNFFYTSKIVSPRVTTLDPPSYIREGATVSIPQQ